MRILVVGGSGFIGSAIIRYATTNGIQADIMDVKDNQVPCINFFRVDISDSAVKDFNFSRYDIVIILAAVTSQLEFEKDPVRSFKVNVNGLLHILEGCKRSNVPKVVFASSSAIYGDTRTRSTEEMPPVPFNMYAASKIMGEYLFKSYTHKSYFNGVIVRYFNVYGLGENEKGDYRSIISIFIDNVMSNRKVSVYGDGTQRRDFINVKDAARITLELAKEQEGIYNVGTGQAVSWNNILDVISNKIGTFSRDEIENPLRDYQYFTEADITKLTEIGLKPEISMEEGIEELLKMSSPSKGT